VRRDGAVVPVVIGGSVLPGGGDEAVMFVLDIRDRKRVERQLELLADVSRVLASALDTGDALAAVARMCAPILGDQVRVSLCDDDGGVRAAAAHPPGAPAPSASSAEVVRTVIAGARPWLAPDRASIVVPMIAGAHALGALELAIVASERRYDERDLVLAEELARRVALAIHTGRLHDERLELLERERHARAEAEKASRAKDEFLAMLGHELRNPLAPILTALQIMRLRGADHVERELTVMERQTQHLVRLVDDLLDVSRITRGKIELRRERVELAEIVAKAIEIASPLIEQRRHVLELHVPPRGLAVDGDPARLAQVVSNLLTNAAKYTEGGGHIAVTASRVGAELQLTVRDDGIGIEPAMLPRVFDMFAQEQQALDRSQGGLGLGLAIVRSLVSLHGGTVEVHSAGRGRGTAFTIRLPAAVPIAGGIEVEEAPAASRAPDGHRILVVDDNEDAADLLAQYLGFLGHVTRIAHDGPAALRVADEFGPEVALLDIGLPVMDGYELARRLRAQPGGDGLRLVAVTGYGQDSDKRRAREASFDAHLVKPISAERLAVVIRDLFGGGAALTGTRRT
jgi:signal transduction histidine kinase/ActR/RegA family two-component response regulator